MDIDIKELLNERAEKMLELSEEGFTKYISQLITLNVALISVSAILLRFSAQEIDEYSMYFFKTSLLAAGWSLLCGMFHMNRSLFLHKFHSDQQIGDYRDVQGQPKGDVHTVEQQIKSTPYWRFRDDLAKSHWNYCQFLFLVSVVALLGGVAFFL